ncbi:SCO6880 family protein [Sanguibacter massiliensis]|uniref:SCO6880 family protein n=1 Tax=Sanguibacter massiliensis TaxID=1973217 RepID=UPI00101AE35F|nr:SCO6880 family protein [Sanguibacter massiliensis]
MGIYLERASFPRLERSGYLFGLSVGQLAWIGSGIGVLMSSFMTQNGGAIARGLLLSMPMVLFGVLSIRRRPLVRLAADQGVWQMRRLLGQTRWRVSPEKPRDAYDMPVPGAAGARMKVLESAFGAGAILWDARTRWATAVVRCTTTSFTLASDDEWARRAAGYSDVLAQLVTHDGVVRVATHARTIPAAAAAAANYYATTSAARGAGADASPWAHEAYRAVLEHVSASGEAQMVSRDVLVTLTIDTTAVRDRIKDGGGGSRGISFVLAQEVAALGALLEAAGAETAEWLDAAEVDEAVRLAYDPSSIDVLAQRRAAGMRPVPAGSAGPVRLIEHADHLVTDDAWHKVFWIAEWPRADVEVGFLKNLICQGSYAHTLTCVMTPVPIDKALRGMGSARVGLNSRLTMNVKLDRHISAELRAEERDLEEREEELTSGGVEVAFTGYITVTAPDEAALGAAQGTARIAASLLDLRVLRGQQAAAFAAASLPLGWGLR